MPAYTFRMVFQVKNSKKLYQGGSPGIRATLNQDLAAGAATDTICPMDFSSQTPCYLTVSIVLYHSSLDRLQATLASLTQAASFARESRGLSTLEVFLVDNSGDEAYGEAVLALISAQSQDTFCRFDYCRQTENRGFGAGHNAVLTGLESDVHLVLNPDVELEESALQIGLARLLEAGDIVLLSPRASGTSGRQEFLCKRYPSVLVLLLRAFAPPFIQARFRDRLAHYEMADLCQGEREVDVALASGCFMLLPTRCLQAVGGFNASYFLYFEDFDLSLRLQKQGRLVFVPAMRIVHHGGYAGRKGLRHLGYFIRSGIRFFNSA